MTTLTWPRTVFVPAEAGPPFPSPNNTTGGTGFGGSEQVVGNTPGRWMMIFAGIDIRTPAQVQAWKAFAAKTKGRLVPFLVPIYDQQRAPSPGVMAVMHGDVAAGAVTAIIQTNTTDGALAEGMFFSVSERLYVIETINGTVSGGAGKLNYNVNIWLPVRELIADGAALEFANPYFRVRLASDGEMKMQLSLFKFASPTVNLVEDV